MKKILLSALIITGCAASVHAQVGGAVNQVENTQMRNQLNQAAQQNLSDSNSVPQLYEGEDSDVGPQSVLKMKPRHTLFQAQVDAQYFYTDNVLLTEKAKIDTGVLVSTAEFALAPSPYSVSGGTLAPRIGYRHQWFDFGLDGEKIPFNSLPLSSLDFNAQTVFADALWSHGNWTFGGGLEAMRLMSTDGYAEFYKELLPHWTARRILPLNDKMAFGLAYEGNYHFTDIRPQKVFQAIATDDVNDRTDHSLLLSYTQVLCEHAILQPYYRFQYTHYADFPGGSRNDYLNSVGAALYLIVCPNFNVRAFVSYDILGSDNIDVQEYRNFEAGGGVNVSFRF